MQMCPNCDEVYDPTEHSKCPKCSNELVEEHGEKYYKKCPRCFGIMYWDDFWKCIDCGEEIDTGEEDNDGIVEY